MFASAIAALNEQHLCTLVKTAEKHIQAAKQRQAKHANKARRAAPEYQPGDLV